MSKLLFLSFALCVLNHAAENNNRELREENNFYGRGYGFPHIGKANFGYGGLYNGYYGGIHRPWGLGRFHQPWGFGSFNKHLGFNKGFRQPYNGGFNKGYGKLNYGGFNKGYGKPLYGGLNYGRYPGYHLKGAKYYRRRLSEETEE